MTEISPHLRRLLAEFVDREVETDRFRRMLDSEEPVIFSVWGGGGVGKSSFQAKMIHEVALRGLAKAEVVWTDTRSHDLLAVTRKIRDDLGPEYFAAFTDLINFFTVPRYELQVRIDAGAEVSVGRAAQISDSHVGDMAGVMIKDVMLNAPRSDMSISESERRARLTDAFIAGMACALRDRQAVVFFDATEKMASETEAWVFGELLPAACERRMGRVKFVLCGRREPEVDRVWRDLFECAELRPLSREHIVDYLERRGVSASARQELASLLLIVSEGNMLSLATYVDRYMKEQQKRLPDPQPA